MEKMLFDSKIKIIHLSSDCVFSGDKGNYSETNIPDGDSIYGITKFCGEIVNEKDLTIRASYIGPTNRDVKEELFDWVLRQNGITKGYANALWNGITTLELAKQVHQAIRNNICGLLFRQELIGAY
jgi:dTDP-4-dehydrorhamnose reductase